MNHWQKFFKSLGIVAITSIPGLMGFSDLSSLSHHPMSVLEISLQFPTARDRGAPKSTSGGGTRGGKTCVSLQPNQSTLTALMPNNNNVGRTMTATPTLYWYIPKAQATQGQFVINDEDQQEVYETTFNLPKTPGIVKLAVPKEAALKPGKQYSWAFMIICDSISRNRDVAVEGTIDLQKPNVKLQKQVAKQRLLEQATLYAQNLLWLETLETAAQLRRENPQAWKELLNSVGLEAIAEAPFTDCCRGNN